MFCLEIPLKTIPEGIWFCPKTHPIAVNCSFFFHTDHITLSFFELMEKCAECDFSLVELPKAPKSWGCEHKKHLGYGRKTETFFNCQDACFGCSCQKTL